MKRRHLLLGTLAAAGQATLSAPLYAQGTFPGKSITMIVPFPPGGVADIVARPIAEAMSRNLGQSVVVENRAGAAGGVGIAHVSKAAADGYTVLLSLSSMVVLPEAFSVMQRPAMYGLDQFTPVARFVADPTVLVVRAESPWKTYAEFIADVRKRPGQVTFGSSGNYGTMHIPMEQLKMVGKVFMLHIPYTGAGPALVGLLGGQVDAVATGPSTIVQQVRAGRLRALAQWGTERLATLPDVPTLSELGVKIDYSQWAGLFAPSGTPVAVIERLRAAARFASQDNRATDALTTAGTAIKFQDAPEFAQFVRADAAKMAPIVRRIGKVE